MTDIDAMIKYMKAFDVSIPEFNNEDFWNKLRTGTKWMVDKYPESPFAEVAESYEHALFLIACIRHEILIERGEHIDRIGKEI